MLSMGSAKTNGANRVSRKLLLGAVALASIVASSSFVSAAFAAVTLGTGGVGVGSSFVIGYSGIVNENPQPGLTGENTFTLQSIANSGGNTVFTLGYSLKNTSSNPITASRISGFGFNTTPNALGSPASSVDGEFDTITLDGNVPQLGTFDICASDGNCAGGANGGVTIGNTGTGNLALAFAGTGLTSVSLDAFYARYQSLVGATGGDSGSGTGTLVPIPAALPLLASALGGLGLIGWRRKKIAASAI